MGSFHIGRKTVKARCGDGLYSISVDGFKAWVLAMTDSKEYMGNEAPFTPNLAEGGWRLLKTNKRECDFDMRNFTMRDIRRIRGRIQRGQSVWI